MPNKTYEKNNLPEDIRIELNKVIDIYQMLMHYEHDVIDIKELERNIRDIQKRFLLTPNGK